MNDDLENELTDSEDVFDDFLQKPSGLGDKIRQSPAAKIAIALIGLVIVFSLVVMFSQNGIKEELSSVPAGSTITSVPGSDEKVAPAYIEAVEQQNEDDLEQAIAAGTSAIPVPIETHSARLDVPEIEEEVEDPLHRWRLLQEERIEREMRTKEAEIEPVTVLNVEQQSEAINNLAESMVEQMDSILSANNEEKLFITRNLINDLGKEGGLANNFGGSGAGQGHHGVDSFSGSSGHIDKEILIPAGKIVYGQMLLEANSDVPSVVLAQMVSGPLRGWKLLGEFSVEESLQKLTITFNLAVNEHGRQYKVNAVMLDPDTSIAALSTDVNHRYFRRIVLPAAAAFIEGFAQAISESGRVTVTISDDNVIAEEEDANNDQEVASGIDEAAEEVREILDDLADVDPEVSIAAGTPIGIFFIENVKKVVSGI